MSETIATGNVYRFADFKPHPGDPIQPATFEELHELIEDFNRFGQSTPGKSNDNLRPVYSPGKLVRLERTRRNSKHLAPLQYKEPDISAHAYPTGPWSKENFSHPTKAVRVMLQFGSPESLTDISVYDMCGTRDNPFQPAGEMSLGRGGSIKSPERMLCNDEITLVIGALESRLASRHFTLL